MEGDTESITADQGSQPHFGRVRVGIVRAGLKKGVLTARLAVRTPEEQRIVELAKGESLELPGHGSLTLTDVRRRATPEGRESVGLVWRASNSTVAQGNSEDAD